MNDPGEALVLKKVRNISSVPLTTPIIFVQSLILISNTLGRPKNQIVSIQYVLPFAFSEGAL